MAPATPGRNRPGVFFFGAGVSLKVLRAGGITSGMASRGRTSSSGTEGGDGGDSDAPRTAATHRASAPHPARRSFGGGQFAATRWSIVLAAAGRGAADGGPAASTSISHRALEELMRAYWFPLYAFVRRQGEAPEEAEAVVQAFFAHLLEKNYLDDVDRSKGKFRSFLLASVKHFLSKHRDRLRAKKRGGGRKVIPLDALGAESRYSIEPADDMTPDRLFERQWALSVLGQVLDRLRDEYAQGGKTRLYEAIEPCLTDDAQAIDYGKAARDLNMTQGAVRLAVHRLRRRYRDLLKAEIAQTVDSPGQVEEEIAYLLNCL